MNTAADPAYSLDDVVVLSFTELIIASGVPETELRQLVAVGVLTPTNPQAVTWTFTARALRVARHAHRLQRDFELDTHAVSVVLRYVERIETLEAELNRLRAQLG